MALLVKKFGGTSVGTLERINRVADKVQASLENGDQIVVVLSAMAGETDKLIDLAKSLQARPDPREYSMLVATGEQVSVALLAMALAARGVKAKSFTGGQAGIQTNSAYKNARIVDLISDPLEQALDAGVVPVVAGFQGTNEAGEITTLGRGGSDTTAVALAAALGADECQIFTDVDGVYTADPRVVPQARRLDRITFEEMLELSSLGAKVLQIRAVEFAGKFDVPLRVLSSFVEGPGTLITYEEKGMEAALVSGIAFNRSEAKITVIGAPDKPGVAFQILGPISAAGIGIDMIIQNIGFNESTDFTFTLHKDDFQQTMDLLEKEILPKIGTGEVIGDTKIAKISLVGVGMRSHAGIASTMFQALGKEGINIQMISTSEIKVSVVVDEKYLELGVRTLHTAFGLDREPIEEDDPMIADPQAKVIVDRYQG